jgi:hypothetical protein
MLTYTILRDEGIVIIELSAPIRQPELAALTRDVDSLIGQKGVIRGFIIHTRSFPRWHDFGAFLNDMNFVFAHQRKIQRVASVTDSKLLMIVHRIMRYVVSPEIRHFSYGDRDAALQWMRETR